MISGEKAEPSLHSAFAKDMTAFLISLIGLRLVWLASPMTGSQAGVSALGQEQINEWSNQRWASQSAGTI